jgi:hypothetical protein
MSGTRKILAAAILACCTHAVATEPASPPPLGSLLKNGWGVPGEAEGLTAVKDKGASVSTAPDVAPVVEGPILKDPVVQAGQAVTSQSPQAGQKEATVIYQADGRPLKADFEALQIDRAPSVPRLQPRRSLVQSNAHKDFSIHNQARVIAAAPIHEVGLPLRTLPDSSQAEVPQSAEICDLVDVAIAGSSSTLLNDRQPLPAASTRPIGQADSGAAGQLPDLDEVASLFEELGSTDDENVIELLQLPLGIEEGVNEDVVLLTERNNLKYAVPAEMAAAITDSWELIESTNAEAVDPLRRAAELWELTKLSLRQARQAAVDGEVAALKTLSMESFRLCLSALDAAEQTDSSAASFQQALDAIRESNDFCLAGDELDNSEQQTLQIILEHKTDLLKQQEGQALSRHEAAFCYMTFARRSLVKASKGIPEASEALMLLGAAESMCVDGNPSHRDAIAVMLQRAAIEICPADHEPHLALGITLSNQGLGEQSRLSLQRSVEIRPTPRAYQELIELATQAEDEAALEDLHVKLQQLTANAEATVVILENDSDSTRASQDKVHGAKSETEAKTRIGWRAMIPFIR